MFIFQNLECFSELSIKISELNFSNCYNKLNENYNI